jgi:hypothetical protein
LDLNRLVSRIEKALGDGLPVTDTAPDEPLRSALEAVFSQDAYQQYLQDEVNRQIIRDYLVNAVMLGLVPETSIEQLGKQLRSPEARASMSLHMLMNSVEQAPELLAHGVPAPLEPLQSSPDTPPHIHLVRT